MESRFSILSLGYDKFYVYEFLYSSSDSGVGNFSWGGDLRDKSTITRLFAKNVFNITFKSRPIMLSGIASCNDMKFFCLIVNATIKYQ